MKPEPASTDTALDTKTSSALALFRKQTDVAKICEEIVRKCVVEIAGRRYVKVEGWMAIANTFGELPSIISVEPDKTGMKAIACLKSRETGAELSRAEGFVGHDEPDWYGGEVERWDDKGGADGRGAVVRKTMKPRAEHAVRAMAQTRGISRVLRQGFAQIVVIIDAELSTIPAEEIGEDDNSPQRKVAPTEPPKTVKRETNKETSAPKTTAAPSGAAETKTETKAPIEVPRENVVALREQYKDGKWKDVLLHFGPGKGNSIGTVELKLLSWWVDTWQPKGYAGNPPSEKDFNLRAALDVAGEEEPRLDEVRKTKK